MFSGPATLEHHIVEIIMRTFNDLDAGVQDINSNLHWRYFFETDFAIIPDLPAHFAVVPDLPLTL